MPLIYLLSSVRNPRPSFVLDLSPDVTVPELRLICEDSMRDFKDFYLVQNGHLLEGNGCIGYAPVHVIFRALGGKGGFGSMLRAIGAQIEKTTNREACRDLSGRRLRDINEEQRLKNWITKKALREKEAKNNKRIKLEKLMNEPSHDFEDKLYEDERSQLVERVAEAFEQGISAATSSGEMPSVIKIKISKPDAKETAEVKAAEIRKRKLDMPQYPKKKPALLWVADDLSNSDEDGDDDEGEDDERKMEDNSGKQLSAIMENNAAVEMGCAAKDAKNGGKIKAEATVTSSSVA
ncbi:splicing regulator SDE2 isoform X2 [Anabrus simplex]|uniref:splicing regulator SDE2 isoform X2 n=1 Tax=Anabrus simplex TaxID=316456 RepID=UPI0035A2BB5E